MSNISARLVLVRRLFLDAEVAAARADGPSRMQAVIVADLAIETAVKAMLEENPITSKHNPLLKELLDALDVPHGLRGKALGIRRKRNASVHDGIEPDAATVGDTLADAADVLRGLFERAGRDFDSFTLVDLVANPLVREPLESAEKSIAVLDKALVYVAIAFRRLEGLLQEVAGKAAGLDLWMYHRPLWDDVQVTSKCADGREKYTLRLLRAVASSMMGTDVLGLVRLRLLLEPLLMKEELKKRQQQEAERDGARYTPPEPIQLHEVQWAIETVALTAYSVERRCPELRNPLSAPREYDWISGYIPAEEEVMQPPWPKDDDATGAEPEPADV